MLAKDKNSNAGYKYGKIHHMTLIANIVESFFFQYKKQVLKKGEILIRADDDPTGIFYLQEGVVKQYYISKKGDAITLNIFKTHSFFPMSWALSGVHNHYYFEAMADCIIHKAPKDAVFEFLKREPDVVFDLFRRVYIGIEGLWLHVEYLSAGNALTKLTATILTLGKRFGQEEKNGIVLQMKISEKELGEYAGMYRETVSREFQVLKKKGLVSYTKGVITIPDMKKLENELTL